MEFDGAVYLFLILSEMLLITTNVVTALNITFTDFKERGIYKIQGENIIVTTKHIEDVALILNEVDSLPEEAPLDILKGIKDAYNFYEMD